MLGAASTIPAFIRYDTIAAVLLIANDVLYAYLYALFVYLVIWRFFILFFHLNWKKSILNSQWKQHLSLDKDATDIANLDFFLRNKETLGDKQKSRKIFFILYIFHASLICAVYVYESIQAIHKGIDLFYQDKRGLSVLLESIMWVPLFCVTVILWKATPSYYDYFFVRNEMKWLCLFYAIDIIGSLSIFLSPHKFLKEVKLT